MPARSILFGVPLMCDSYMNCVIHIREGEKLCEQLLRRRKITFQMKHRSQRDYYGYDMKCELKI